MSSLPLAVPLGYCWNTVGVFGDGSCPELAKVTHCHNCPVFAAAGRRFLDAPAPDGYLAEWAERLAAPAEELDAERLSVLTFRLGEEWLALPVRALVEVTTPRPVRTVPHTGALLAGLVNVRGELLLCARLDRLLGADADGAAAPGERRRLVVAAQEGERWAFLADEVDQVHRFPAAELGPAPATVARAARRLTRGVFGWRGRAIGLLDEGRLFEALRARVR